MGAAEGTNPKKIRTIDLIFAVTITACGALFFLIVMRAMNGTAESVWLVPLLCAIIYVAFLSIFAVSVGIKKLLSPVIFISLLPSVILMPVISHIVVVTSMYFIIMYGLLTMRHTLFNLLTINMRTIVRSGIFYVSFGLIVILTSQYYFLLRENVDRVFDASEYVNMVSVVTDMALKKSNIESVSIDKMTIDDFLHFVIQDVYKDNSQENVIAPKQENNMVVRWAGSMGIAIEKIQSDIEMQAVESMRKNIATKIGRDVRGDELASHVLSELVTMQVHDMIRANPTLYEHRAGIFATIFFVILMSIAAIGKVIAVILAQFGFMLLRELKFIHITKTQRDAEVIAL